MHAGEMHGRLHACVHLGGPGGRPAEEAVAARAGDGGGVVLDVDRRLRVGAVEVCRVVGQVIPEGQGVAGPEAEAAARLVNFEGGDAADRDADQSKADFWDVMAGRREEFDGSRGEGDGRASWFTTRLVNAQIEPAKWFCALQFACSNTNLLIVSAHQCDLQLNRIVFSSSYLFR